MRFIILLISVGLVFCTTDCFAQKEGEVITIQKGKEVSFDYTLTVEGQIIDSSQNKEPLTYVHGEGKIIPGLARQLEGMKIGDKKDIPVNPEEAYGEINPNAFQEVPKSKLPGNVEPRIGMTLQANAPDGRSQLVRITEVKDDSIVIDMNHPLAVKKLNFQIEVVSIK